jgi:chromate transporter
MSGQEAKAPESAPFFDAFLFWLKLGFISFGGPAGQISMMHRELVERRRWISERRFLHGLNYTMMLPGPEAQQLATYIGWLLHGTRGGIVAGTLFIVPSLFILIALTWIYMVFGNASVVEGILFGVKPAVTAIVVFSAYRIGQKVLKNQVLWGIAVMAFVAITLLKVPFPYIVLLAGVLGYLGSRFLPEKFQAGKDPASPEASYGPALIDDDTPVPSHARFRWVRAITFGVLGVAVWVVAMGLLLILNGWEGTLTQMAWFFSKAALVTFGGAYAVLPYVYQGGVEEYGWLTGSQMIDGLALGETTPGPLIMVVAFVGFVGAWTKEVLGSDMLLLAGAAGATVATLFTFIPSFLFILVGGPVVEATRNDAKLTAPLVGITAAVVGVILNLALFFAYHVLWPDGLDGGFQWFSALMGIAAALALFKWDIGILKLIVLSAAVGLAYTHLV